MSANTIITKYRPADFDEVIGHTAELRALQRALTGTTPPHCYLFDGPGGLGKTTLARIVGAQMGCDDVVEIDAASNSGVDAMRSLTEVLNYTALTNNGRRIVIIDECHRLTANAWDVLLKPMEEPPKHLFFALCTTAPEKIPNTIVIRCYRTSLKRLRPTEMEALLLEVAEMEEWDIPGAHLGAVLEAAQGSPRAGLTMMQAISGARSMEEVERLLGLMREGNPLYDLCMLLLRGSTSWKAVQAALSRIAEEDYSGAVEKMSGFLAAAMVQQKDAKQAQRIWRALDALMFPASSYVPRAVIAGAIGRVLWSEGSTGE